MGYASCKKMFVRFDGMENQGRNQQQPNNPVTLTQVAHLLRRKTAALWEAASGSYDDRTQKFNEARRAGDYIGVLDRCDAVQLFRVRAGHSLLRSDMFRRKWSATTVCRLCGEENEDCSHVLFGCGELSGIRETDWSDITLQEALWGSKENMVRAARLLRVFISRATRLTAPEPEAADPDNPTVEPDSDVLDLDKDIPTRDQALDLNQDILEWKLVIYVPKATTCMSILLGKTID
ncbi:hypothetical protein PoB_000610800 [Plakobranchus ocellatus]|uniref:Reverse transcriptase zinc-binding domain-containing protein n=1 Tax=Plakobranchus ocellatus TaxID=259542 RepID=A0AAV3YAY4_9GAST|nr:hypothetical protein PoB_000610800 [Plakobranchus ocellatus]